MGHSGRLGSNPGAAPSCVWGLDLFERWFLPLQKGANSEDQCQTLTSALSWFSEKSLGWGSYGSDVGPRICLHSRRPGWRQSCGCHPRTNSSLKWVTQWECKLVQPLWKKVWRVLKRLKIELPYDPAIAPLGIYPGDTGVLFRRDTCTPCL